MLNTPAFTGIYSLDLQALDEVMHVIRAPQSIDKAPRAAARRCQLHQTFGGYITAKDHHLIQ